MKRFDYRLGTLPDGWEDQTEYVFKGPTQDGMTHRLLLTIDRVLHPQSDTLEGYAEFKSTRITAACAGVSIKKREKVRLAELEAVELSFLWRATPELERISQYYFLIWEDLGFTFECTYTLDSFAMLREDVQAQVINCLPGYR